jgi:hypothetical protein
MPEDQELRSLARQLHSAMTESMSENIFIPTGGVFLGTKVKPGEVNDEVAWQAYAQWHEGVHMMQLVTSPYVWLFAFRLRTLALEAIREGREQDKASVPLEELKEEYSSANSELSEISAAGYSPFELLETHAVSQGLLWAMPDNADSLCWLANHFYTVYKKSPNSEIYLRLLNLTAKTMGGEAAIRLLPRMCFLALQTNDPAARIATLAERITSERAVTRVCDYTPRQFCEWADVDVALLCKSLRERNTPLRDHPWLNFFSDYFDEFESISSIDDRLNLLMGVQGGTTFTMFAPVFTVFENGDMLSRRGTGTYEKKEWLKMTSRLVAGLERLN